MKFTTAAGLKLGYEILGAGDPPLLLLHGRTSNRGTFVHQTDALSKRCRLVLADLRGHGESDGPKERSAYSMEIWVEDLRELVEGLGLPPFVLLGHSMGGFVAIRFALAHGALLRGLILEDTGPGRLPAQREAKSTSPSADPDGFAAEELRLAKEEGMAAVVAHYGDLEPSKRERFLAHKPWSFAHAIQVCRKATSVADRVGEITVPTLILCGERDAGFLRASQFMEARIPRVRSVVFAGAGHSPHREARDAYNAAVIDFLDEIVAAG